MCKSGLHDAFRTTSEELKVTWLILDWAPFINVVVVPPAILLLLSRINKVYWHFAPDRLWKLAAIGSYVVISISCLGLGILSMQFSR